MPLDAVNKETGWLSKYAFQHDSLAADSVGREAMADGYITAAKFSTLYLRLVEHFNKVLAGDTDYVRSNEDLSAALPIVFTITNQPDVPRTLTFTFDSHVNVTEYSITFVGVNAKGETITETHTQVHVSPWARTTLNAFAKITSITMTARTGTGAGDTADIGISDNLGLANDLGAAAGGGADVIKIVKSAAAGNSYDMLPGDYTADITYDYVNVSVGLSIVDGDSFTIYYKTNLANLT